MALLPEWAAKKAVRGEGREAVWSGGGEQWARGHEPAAYAAFI